MQQECIPQAILGMDVLCQAKSGMGKTAVFVLACLQQLETSAALTTTSSDPQVIVLCHTRELAFQIKNEFTRFTKFLDVKTAVFYGGVSVSANADALKNDKPHVIVGTPGRVGALIRDGTLKMGNIKHFILDECDKLLDSLGMLLSADRRYASGCPRYFQIDTPPQASNDVLSHSFQGNSPHLQKVYAKCNLFELTPAARNLCR